MLIFSAENLAYFAVPKTGTTSVELALRARADIVFAKGRKHMPAQRFHAKVAPFLETAFSLRPDRVAVMRDPVDQLGSWYRYRTTAHLRGSQNSTAGISFDEFVAGYLSDEQPEYARVGSQVRFMSDNKGNLGMTHLFRYDDIDALVRFLSLRLGKDIQLGQANVSPKAELTLAPELQSALRKAHPQDFDLYERLSPDA